MPGGAVFVELCAAHADTSALTGLVSDPTGELTQHVSVKVMNQATSISASVATSDMQALQPSVALQEFTIQTNGYAAEFGCSAGAVAGIPNITIGPGFGQITTTATPARQIQFALKYRF